MTNTLPNCTPHDNWHSQVVDENPCLLITTKNEVLDRGGRKEISEVYRRVMQQQPYLHLQMYERVIDKNVPEVDEDVACIVVVGCPHISVRDSYSACCEYMTDLQARHPNVNIYRAIEDGS